MEFFKENKKITLIILFSVLVCVLACVTFFLFPNNKSIETSNIVNEDNHIIPNVTDENTTFKISDIENKAESVNIIATNRLLEYNLCYYITFDNNLPLDINNSDYSLLNDIILIIDENCTIYFKYELNGIYSNNAYKITISNIKTASKETDKVSEKELKKETVNKNEISKQSTSPYFIKVNYGANVVTIYTKDESGNYTVPYKAMVCSCGKYTPKSGTYKTSDKYSWRLLVHDVYGQYATRIVKKILFHSVPYSTNQKDALLYEEYDKLGTTASEGCIRLTIKDCKWIYDNCPPGTMVEFYSDSNPGPLGKPTAQKISSFEECRNWDPTDPASENPWHTYEHESETKEPAADVPSTDIPNTDIPTTDTDIPSVDEPTLDTPTTNVPSIDDQITNAPIS